MRDLWYLIIIGAISAVIHSFLPKNLKSSSSFVVIALLVSVSGLFFFKRRERRRSKELLVPADQNVKGSPAIENVQFGMASLVVSGSPSPLGITFGVPEPKNPVPKTERIRVSLPRLWELFSFVLPGKIQRECFDPAYNDLLRDYVRARKFRGKWARRWIAFAFTMRTIFMVADCFRVLLQSGAGRILLGLLPESWRGWWSRQ